MEPITDQQHFETLFRDPTASGRRISDTLFIIYFTATWCMPCKKLDKELIVAAAKEREVPIYICDFMTNDYTPGYWISYICSLYAWKREKSLTKQSN